MKVYGKKVLTGIYPCRFPQVQKERAEGGHQIEIVVPKAKAKDVQDLLYGGDDKLIDFNKASAKAKVPRKLWSPLYLYDDEAGESVRDDDGEKVESDTEVVFRFKTQWKPTIQFKKGLDKTAEFGAGSMVQISGSLYGNDEGKDENGKPLKYVLLSLAGVRVHTIVAPATTEAFEHDDDFEDAEPDFEESAEESAEDSAPTGEVAGKKNF